MTNSAETKVNNTKFIYVNIYGIVTAIPVINGVPDSDELRELMGL